MKEIKISIIVPVFNEEKTLNTILEKIDKLSRYEFDLPSTATTKKVNLKVEYATIGFREIRNYRAFGLLSLWSQIGGFIGIFLGYSLLQVPELTCGIIDWAKRVMNNT